MDLKKLALFHLLPVIPVSIIFYWFSIGDYQGPIQLLWFSAFVWIPFSGIIRGVYEFYSGFAAGQER